MSLDDLWPMSMECIFWNNVRAVIGLCWGRVWPIYASRPATNLTSSRPSQSGLRPMSMESVIFEITYRPCQVPIETTFGQLYFQTSWSLAIFNTDSKWFKAHLYGVSMFATIEYIQSIHFISLKTLTLKQVFIFLKMLTQLIQKLPNRSINVSHRLYENKYHDKLTY